MDLKYKLGIIIAIIIICSYLIFIPSTQYERIQIAGSTSVQPVAEKLAKKFGETHPNVRINVQGGGSSLGISSVSQGITQIGTSSRELTQKEKIGLNEYVIGKEGIVIAVNNQNNITYLNKTQIKDIFSGKVKNWKDVGGPDLEIHVITRESGSGTRSAFENLIMGKGIKIKNDAIVQSSTESVKQAVKQDPGAIGFVSLARMTNDVKALKIGGITPSEQTVSDGSYSLQTPFLFIVKGEPKGVVKEFIDFTLSPEGQAIVKGEKVVPVK
ncbi:MAG: phosphate ABC transporter substrate-binding protein [Methanobacterium sp.]|uniref:phosphate ABC transporter substrate-binding protein n=1 Tax=Methanobacterium sp. TaxID=2164 RepID=UPI003D648399|nr:phosphate ABC transporter substrate-binding protein [Methanobacterium sp.]